MLYITLFEQSVTWYLSVIWKGTYANTWLQMYSIAVWLYMRLGRYIYEEFSGKKNDTDLGAKTVTYIHWH